MSTQKQLAFCYLTCERLLPNYAYFSRVCAFGSPTVLRTAIDFLYDAIFSTEPDSIRVRQLIGLIDPNTPDTEDFETIFVSSALDACSATIDSLEFLLNNDFKKISDVSTSAIDTVEMYTSDLIDNDPDNTSARENEMLHPLVEREIAIQQAIISVLDSKPHLTPHDIETLLHIQSENTNGSLNL